MKWLLLLLLFPAGETLHTGTFSKKSQKIEGTYTIKKVDGKTIIQFDAAFKTKKGPDLQLVLTPLDFASTNGKNALKHGAVSLGLLKSHKGAQSFELPDHVDLSKMKAILIHCVKYDKLWGGASLQ